MEKKINQEARNSRKDKSYLSFGSRIPGVQILALNYQLTTINYTHGS